VKTIFLEHVTDSLSFCQVSLRKIYAVCIIAFDINAISTNDTVHSCRHMGVHHHTEKGNCASLAPPSLRPCIGQLTI